MWHCSDGMGWWMIWMVVFWGVIITLIVWGIRKLMGYADERSNTSSRRDPLEIARQRYARGEISREEFEQIKRDIS